MNHAGGRLDPESAAARLGEMAFHYDRIAVNIGLVGILPLVFYSDDEDAAFAPFFYKALQAATTVCRASLAAETQCNCRKDGALAATIFSNDEIEEGTEFTVEAHVAHEVDASDALDNAIFCNGAVTQHTRAEAETLGGTLVVGSGVAEMLEVIVAHQLILGFGGRVWRGRVIVRIRTIVFGIVVNRGNVSNEASFDLDVLGIGKAKAFPLSRPHDGRNKYNHCQTRKHG